MKILAQAETLGWCSIPTNVLVGLSVDQAVGVAPPRARHPEQERVRLDHVTVARLKLVAGDQ